MVITSNNHNSANNMHDQCLLKSVIGEASRVVAEAAKKDLNNIIEVRKPKVTYGCLSDLKPKVRSFVEESARLCQPDNLHICDGSERELRHLLNVMQQAGMIEPLPKYNNCWLARTDPGDVARVESKTFMVTKDKRDTVPAGKEGVKSMLANWMSPEDLKKNVGERFPGCMSGRTMYVVPYSMGPVGSPLSKIGVQVTDSPYVVVSMRTMTRMGSQVLTTLGEEEFVHCLHSVGCPLPLTRPLVNNWPCDPARTIVTHVPDTNEIISFGSGYGGNSLLGKKCFALRLGSTLARREGWLAEHMLILGITNPQGVKRYVAAAFPSACGKTNLAMMTPSLPGYKIECVGDDIAWMKFDDEGVLRAINPENGFFGVAPGTSMKTNPVAMQTVRSNTVFTNVAKTSDGGVFWEGLEKETPNNVSIRSWLGEENWSPESGKPAAHPNSRFCTPAGQCPIIDPAWEDSTSVWTSSSCHRHRNTLTHPLTHSSSPTPSSPNTHQPHTTKMASQVRMNYHEDCEASINKQVNMEFYASYVYMSMSYYFDRDDVALPGMKNFFKEMSDEEREHAEKLMKFQNKRGGRVVLQAISAPASQEWGSVHAALTAALELERQVNQSLLDIHGTATRTNDPHLTDYLESEFLEEQVSSIKKLGDMITQAKRAGTSGLGEYLFDQNQKS